MVTFQLRRGTAVLFSVLLVLLLAVTAFWLYERAGSREERRVRARLAELVKTVVKERAAENPILAAAAAKKLENLFAETIDVEVDHRWRVGTRDRADFVPAFVLARQQLKSLSIRCGEARIQFPEASTADLFVTAVVEVQFETGEPIHEVRDLAVRLEKDESGEWRFRAFRTEQVIQK